MLIQVYMHTSYPIITKENLKYFDNFAHISNIKYKCFCSNCFNGKNDGKEKDEWWYIENAILLLLNIAIYTYYYCDYIQD